MQPSVHRSLTLSVVVILAAVAGSVRAAVVEEVVAWVNGDIITMSEYQEQEQAVLAQLYRQYTGVELDAALKEVRAGLLMQMIDRKILVDQAERLYDIDVMGNVFLDFFKEQQNISSDAEFEELLKEEGLTINDVKARLIDMQAPDEVIRFEVTSRISLSELEIEASAPGSDRAFGVIRCLEEDSEIASGASVTEVHSGSASCDSRGALMRLWQNGHATVFPPHSSSISIG